MHRFICDFLLDIVQNSFEAGAPSVQVTIEEDAGRLACTVTDTGKGMDETMRNQVLDPFHGGSSKHPGRPVSLGIPFLAEAMRETGGQFHLSSQPGQGTTVRFVCDLHHVDTPPTGDIPGTILLLLSDARAGEVSVFRSLDTPKGRGSYRVTKSGLVQELGDLRKGDALLLARAYLRSQEGGLERWKVERRLVLSKGEDYDT